MWDGHSVNRFIIEIENKPPYENLKEIVLRINVEEIASIGIKNIKGDPLYYDAYDLTENQILELKKYALEDFNINIDNCKYVLFCEQA